MNDAMLVALGGLLHDIGKFVQRAGWRESKGRTHGEIGGEFLRRQIEAKPHLSEKHKELPLFSEYHHESALRNCKVDDAKMRNLLYIVSEADRISASEREIDEEMEFSVENPLVSVFCSVNLGKGDAKRTYYRLRELDVRAFFSPEEDVKVSLKDYKELFSRFDREFEDVIAKGLDFNHLLYVLEKYTTFIPAITVEWNDISLYDHLRTTSAIALCMYYYHEGEIQEDIAKKIRDGNEKKFLLIGGDISGIQDFIYTITSKGALKYLRARSVFLELLVEDVVEEILDRLKLTRANVIYSGGGRFYILAPNTDEVKKNIEELRCELNGWLFEKFWSKLYFAIDFVELSGNELKNFRTDGKSLWEAVNMKLKIKKLRKFIDDRLDLTLIERRISENECDACKSPSVDIKEEEGRKLCDPCFRLWLMGRELLGIDGFIRIKDAEGYYEFPFSRFYGYTESKEIPRGSKVFVKNGYRVYSGSVSIPYYVCDYALRNQRGEIKNFDELSEEAIGSKKIGVLRMDVDDLGKIFSMGLERRGEEERKVGTFSRVATLSRLLNHFFKNCLRILAEGKLSEHLPDNLPRLSRKRGEKQLVVVYSGGDDLFIVGAWDQVFEMAFEIEALFRKYVGENPNITISAGYAIFDPKYPLYRMAEITGEREERAKEEGDKISEINGIEIKRKGRICLVEENLERENGDRETIFKSSYTWDEFRRIWSTYITKIYDEDRNDLKEGLPRAMIRKIFDVRRIYTRNPEGLRWSYLLLYYLSRTKYNGRRLVDELGELARRDVQRIKRKEPQDIYLVGTPLKIVDLAIRRR